MKKKKMDLETQEFVSRINADTSRFMRFVGNKKKYLFTVIVVSLCLLCVTAVFAVLDGGKKSELTALSKDENSLQKEYNAANKKYLEELLLGNFSQEQLTQMAENYFEYTIYINGKPLKAADQVIYMSGTTLTIKIVEKAKANELPENILKLGAIQDYTQVINFLYSEGAPKITSAIEGETNITQVSYSGIKKGSTISMIFNDDFLKKLGTNERMIEIVKNK